MLKRLCIGPSGLLRSIVVLAALQNAMFVGAQQLPLPPSTDPGRLQERLGREPEPSRSIEVPGFGGGEKQELPASLNAVRVTLTGVRIEGAQALPESRLQERVRGYLEREITGAEIFDIARSLTVMYREAGYLLSYAVIPPQTLSDGRLTVRIIEGYIAEVRIEGDASVAASLARIGEHLKLSRPLAVNDLERHLLLANDLPGVRVRSVLSPSRTPGAADLTLIATVTRADGFVSLDNYGSKFLGSNQLTMGVTANQIGGETGQIRFVGVAAGESNLTYGQVSYSQVVSSEGLKVNASLSDASTRPGDVLRPFDIHGHANSTALGMSYPFLRTRNRSLTGRVVFDQRNIDMDVLKVRIVQDRIRAMRLGAAYFTLDAFDGRNTLDLEWSQGVGGTRESDSLKSRAEGDSSFARMVLDYERVQPLGNQFSVTMGLGGQWANGPLLSSEQFGLGGRRFGRAYEPAELTGDRAIAFRVEPAYSGLSSSGLSIGGQHTSYQAYGFYDIGRVWDISRPTAGVSSARGLESGGFGIRGRLGGSVSAALEAAWPLGRPVASYQGKGNSGRLLGSVTLRF